MIVGLRATGGTSDIDLFMSAGVPYSHLDHDEFQDAMTRILDSASQRTRPTAVVVDVLGRYSIEWASRWHLDRWDYQMSFFQGAGLDNHIAAPMSFHSRETVDGALRRAQQESGVELAAVQYFDRSVTVGRHTSTGTFNPDLPNYRDLVNQLHRGDTDLDLKRLRFDPPAHDAPREVSGFFTALSVMWNAHLDRAIDCESRTRTTAAARCELGDSLCALEQSTQQGIGAGHSLICLAVTRPRS